MTLQVSNCLICHLHPMASSFQMPHCILNVPYFRWPVYLLCELPKKSESTYTRLGMSVTTQGRPGRQYVTGPGRNISKYRFVLLNGHRFGES